MNVYHDYFRKYNAQQLLTFWDWYISKKGKAKLTREQGAVQSYEKRFDELATHIRMLEHCTFQGTTRNTTVCCSNSGAPK